MTNREIGIEPLHPRQAAGLRRYCSDPDIARLPRVPPCDSLAATKRWIAESIERDDEYAFAVVHATSGSVGMVEVTAMRGQARDGQLTYWIGRPFRGRGYATLAGRLVLRAALHQLRLRRIDSCAHADNAASIRVLQKLGFRRCDPQPIAAR